MKLKGQVQEEQEQSRKQVYEVQVSLAKLREAIEAVPEARAEVDRPGVEAEKKRSPKARAIATREGEPAAAKVDLSKKIREPKAEER